MAFKLPGRISSPSPKTYWTSFRGQHQGCRQMFNKNNKNEKDFVSRFRWLYLCCPILLNQDMLPDSDGSRDFPYSDSDGSCDVALFQCWIGLYSDSDGSKSFAWFWMARKLLPDSPGSRYVAWFLRLERCFLILVLMARVMLVPTWGKTIWKALVWSGILEALAVCVAEADENDQKVECQLRQVNGLA